MYANAVQRRLGDVQMTLFDQRLHVAEEEGQQQGADVAAVHVGIGHDDDAAIAQARQVEVIADAGAQGRDQRLDFVVGQDLVQAGALGVEDLAAQRQDRLEVPVATLLWREPPPKSPSTMYSSHFGGSRSEQSASLPGRVRLSRADLRMTRSRALRAASRARAEVRHFSTIALAGGGFSSRKVPNASPTICWTKVCTSGFISFTLVWLSNCGSGCLMLTMAVRPSRVSSPVKLGSASLSKPLLAGVIVDHARQGRAQTGQVRAAVDGVDGVGKGVDRFGVSIGVLDGGFDADAVHLFFDVHDRVQHLPVAVQVTHERGDAAFEVEGHLAVGTLVQEVYRYAACDEGHFAEALHQGLKAIFHLAFENFWVVFKGSAATRIVVRDLADDGHRNGGVTALVALIIDLAVAADLALRTTRTVR